MIVGPTVAVMVFICTPKFVSAPQQCGSLFSRLFLHVDVRLAVVLVFLQQIERRIFILRPRLFRIDRRIDIAAARYVFRVCQVFFLGYNYLEVVGAWSLLYFFSCLNLGFFSLLLLFYYNFSVVTKFNPLCLWIVKYSRVFKSFNRFRLIGVFPDCW